MNDIGKLDVTPNYLIFKMQKKVSQAQRDFNQTSSLILFMPTAETPENEDLVVSSING